MPASGIKPSDDVRNKYNRVFKNDKKGGKLPYAVFKFSKDFKEVVVDYDPKYYEKQHTYTELVGLLPDDDPRYFVYELPHKSKEHTFTRTVILISWFPGKSSVKAKFLAGSTTSAMADGLGLSKGRYFQGEDVTDISEPEICSSGGWTPCGQDVWDAMPRGPLDVKPEEATEDD